MSKKYLLPLFILLFVSVRFFKNEEQTSSSVPYIGKVAAKKLPAESVEKNLVDTSPARLPAQVSAGQNEKPDLTQFKKMKDFKKMPSEVQNLEEYGLNESLKDLPRGMVLASSLRAVSKNDFSTDFGTIIREQGNMVYFRPHNEASDESWSNVVYDKKTSKIYPLSTVIKIFHIADAQRNDLVSKGLDEYYYHESLHLFYTQSSNSKVVTLAGELKKMGYEIELEVVKDSVRPR